MHGSIRQDAGMKTCLYGPRENAEPAGSCRGPGRARNKEEAYPVVGRRRRKMHRCALVAKQKRVELTLRENVKCTRRNGMWWR